MLRGDRRLLDSGDELVDETGGVGARGARRLGVAVGDEGIERVLEALRLVGGEVGRTGVRFDGAVERHRPDLVGEELRVHAAEAGAVGEAEVAELVVADRLPDAVHVTSGVDRAEVRQLVAVLLLAGVREALVERVELVDLIGLGHGVERRVDVLLLVAHADERVALTDAAGIEAHEIEALA